MNFELKSQPEELENEANAQPAEDEPTGLKYNVKHETINIDAIEDIERTQLRERTNDATFKELKRLFTAAREASKSEKWEAGRIPEITVVQKPKSKGKFWIIDGHHRYQAAKAAGVKWLTVAVAIPKIFKVADLEDLHFLQARENATTQANRTTETKFNAVEAVLKKHHHWNNNQIARYCTVSSSIVEVVRSRMIASGKIPKHEKPQEKAAAAVADPENAKKSNRELAKEIGVGEATVRRVRQDSKKNFDAFPACLKCGKGLDPKRRKGLTYTDENGEKVKFCCRECVQAYARERDLILDESKHILSEKPKRKEEPHLKLVRAEDEPADVPVVDADSAALDKVSSRAQDWIDEQQQSAEPKGGAYSRREDPDGKKEAFQKRGYIVLTDRGSLAQITVDVYNWLGDRAEAFAVYYSEYVKQRQEETKK